MKRLVSRLVSRPNIGGNQTHQAATEEGGIGMILLVVGALCWRCKVEKETRAASGACAGPALERRANQSGLAAVLWFIHRFGIKTRAEESSGSDV
jgi:hypothetical protein